MPRVRKDSLPNQGGTAGNPVPDFNVRDGFYFEAVKKSIYCVATADFSLQRTTSTPLFKSLQLDFFGQPRVVYERMCYM